MNCSRCGANMIPNAQFCGACGMRASEMTGAQQNAPTPSPAPPGFEAAGSGFTNNMGGGASNTGGGETRAGGGINIDEDSRGQGRGYSYEVLHQPSYALAVVRLQAEQSIQAESGAMVSMSANVELQSQMKGGLMGALKRTVGGESAFVSTFTARGGPGEVTLAPGGPGDIAAIELSNQLFFVQSSSYLAGDAGLTVDTKWGGAKSFFGGEGLFVLQVRGTGLLLLSSFGAIHRKRLAPGERYVVDTGHLVAWEGSTQYTLRKAAAGFFRSMVSGEGIVAEFTGPGEILIQTRNLAAFVGLLKPFLPTQGSGGGGFNFNVGG
ncbi:MAG TPA: TIGR00266 family protein [Pyrinomonadaceae bacterium]|nr:TIGR00266 family protein [Pyrinomonadaceae bacterium]